MMESHQKKILIADDDPAILEVLTLFLEDVGYEVETTQDGLALQAFEPGSADKCGFEFIPHRFWPGLY